MVNLTQQEIIASIDDDRGESSSTFYNEARILRLMNRCTRQIIRTPGVRTVKDTQSITFTGSGSYSLDADVKDIINLISGSAGTSNSVTFGYLPPDEFDQILVGYAWTIKEKGKIEIYATDTNNLPTATLSLNYWSTNIVLDDDGSTKKALWDNDADKSRLAPEYDDIYIHYVMTFIHKRDGNKQDSKDAWSFFKDALDSLIAQGGEHKATRPLRSFGHHQSR